MGSEPRSEYPWGREGNYWGWVDRRARMLHDCPFCGAVAGDPCVTVTSTRLDALIGSYPLSRPHAGRTSPVEAEARKIRIGDRD